MRFDDVERTILFGGGALLIRTARELQAAQKTVGVVTSPRHANEILSESGDRFVTLLEREGLDFVSVKTLESANSIPYPIDHKTLGISFGAAWIFQKDYIERFGGKLLNLHGARLPQDRGGGGFSWRILMDHRLSCSMLHQITPGIDDGPIVDFEEFVFPSQCRIPLDFERFALEKNGGFLKSFFEKCEQRYTFSLKPQTAYLGTYWPRLSTLHHGIVDWRWSSLEIDRFICAFDEPYPGASSFIQQTKVFIRKSFVVNTDGSFHPFQRGIVYRKSGGVVFVACGDAAIAMGSITNMEGTNIYDRIKVGDRFHTPVKYLEQAKDFRAVYLADTFPSDLAKEALHVI